MSTEFAHAILNNVTNAIVVLDESLEVYYLNTAAESLFSLAQRKIDSPAFTALYDHLSVDLHLITQTLISGQPLSDSDVTLVVDGNPLSIELQASPVSFQKQLLIVIEMQQQTPQRRMTQELSLLAQQQAAKELVRGLAHEIKNPLGGLRGAAQLLEKTLPDPDLKEYTQIIIEQADRLRNLVDRLLGPQRPGIRQQGNIHKVLENVRQLIALDDGNCTKIVRDYDPSLPDFEMDSEQLEQALLNVVRNAAQALRHTPDGEIILRTRTEHQTLIHGQRYRLAARIEIIDNGPGIPAAIQDTLFYPMVSGRQGGTGLGLSIAQNLIDQHKGKIEVSSSPGHTNFTFYLPINPAAADHVQSGRE
uniref:nitrogen regulation protein NR(II) n=1 Tax=Thaumasiovibrio occultus TaxID=1891184 RepID=UPI000B364AC5|nr:nitrogen regulation protein NR(II) [Thaumasiovibrio occultus]